MVEVLDFEDLPWNAPPDEVIIDGSYLRQRSSTYKILHGTLHKIISSDSDSDKGDKNKSAEGTGNTYSLKPKGSRYVPCYFDETKIKYPVHSRLTKDQQAAYLELMVKFNNQENETFSSPRDEEDFTRFKALRDKVENERYEFKEFVRKTCAFNQDRYLLICPDVKRYIEELWGNKLDEVKRYPARYDQLKVVSLVYNDRKQYVSLKLEKHLLELGSIPWIILPNNGKNFRLHNNYAWIARQAPPDGRDPIDPNSDIRRVPVSEDKNAEKLAVRNEADVVISGSALRNIVDNHPSSYERTWDMPIVVRECTDPETGLKRNVIFVDKPLPPRELTNMEKNMWFYKITVRAAVCRRNHPKAWRLGETENQDESREEPMDVTGTHDRSNSEREPFECESVEGQPDERESVEGEPDECETVEGEPDECESVEGEPDECKTVEGEPDECESVEGEPDLCEVVDYKPNIADLPVYEPSKSLELPSDLSEIGIEEDHKCSDVTDSEDMLVIDCSDSDRSPAKKSKTPERRPNPSTASKETGTRITRSMARLVEKMSRVNRSLGQKPIQLLHSDIAIKTEVCEDETNEDKIEEKATSEQPSKDSGFKETKEKSSSARPSEDAEFKGWISPPNTPVSEEKSTLEQTSKDSGFKESKEKSSSAQPSKDAGFKGWIYPPKSRNVSYKLWKLYKEGSGMDNKEESSTQEQELRVIVRCHVDGYQFVDGTKMPLIAIPKLEYQTEFGAESLTQSEFTQQLMSLYLRPDAGLVRARVNANTGEIMMVQRRCLKELLSESCQHLTRSSSQVLGTLYNVLWGLVNLEPGTYLLSHNPKMGSFANLRQHHWKGRINLHEMYSFDPKLLPESDKFIWNPIDYSIMTPYHEAYKRVPGTYPPFIVVKGKKVSRNKRLKIKKKLKK